ncbi:MAG: hypothetical protein WC162_03000 [Sphaerochaetaceae bacterium]
MEAQVITQILDTEQVADTIVRDAKEKSNEIINEVEEKASKDFENQINEIRTENRKLLESREKVFQNELKEIENKEVVSGSTKSEIEKLADQIVDYITTAVLD